MRTHLALVTGAEGFLGRHVSRSLARAGWRVIGLGRAGLPDPELANWQIDGVKRGTINRALLSEAVTEYGVPDLIVHAAGSSSVGRSAANPETSFVETVESTRDVLDLVVELRQRPRLILLSSAAVYGNQHRGPIPVATDPAPISVYGYHKLEAEQLVLQAVEKGASVRIVRFFSLYGPGLRKQLLWDVLTRVHGGENPLRLSGTGHETRDFLFVEDAAALVLQLSTGSAAPLIVNGGRGEMVEVRHVVQMLLARAAVDVETTFSGEERAGDPRSLVAEVSCHKALGFTPKIGLREGLDRFVSWAATELSAHQRRIPTPTP